MELDEALDFMRQHLGPDWAEALIHARAFVGSRATNEEANAVEQRAVELVSNVGEDWSLETRQAAAEAWRTLWYERRDEERDQD